MKTVAIVSTVGGAGRTTVTAELATLLAWHGHPALAVECDPRGVLGFHFGLRAPAGAGLCNSARWNEAGQRSDDGVLFVPWGDPGSAAEQGRMAERMERDPHWLRGLLAQVDLPSNALALVDSAPWPSPHARQAIAAADLVLVLVPPQPQTCATLPPLRAALRESGAAVACAVTRLQPARQLHTDISVLLRATLDGELLPYEVHEDAAVPEAFARGESFCRSTPYSQAAHDLQGLASWVSGWSLLAVRGNAGPASVRDMGARQMAAEADRT
ncbi:cellulose biosynthesis protein BcsQ [Cupriavidus oxalaticus]|uniref:Cellulose synthase operon protein YhjQ n=1 Tax=Cupriavidus oxalaticus TaxID=96344 RepID=A0A4P7L647_9BURK|nr:cellulose biosynthesis protein BcsQ [Cupriavidus oxalaticus]QBY51068.1 cellulose synthase operon protein YhjQ [Cupriavidus oxalaticus]